MSISKRDILKKLGDRGLVVCESQAGEKKYFFVLEEEWAERKIPQAKVDHRYPQLVEHGAAFAKSVGVLVNFDLLHVAKAEAASAGSHQRPHPGGHARATESDAIDQTGIVIREGDAYYGVPRALWRKNPLPPGAEGDAGTLVDRGALVANIPDDDIPIGTYCVLVNLALLNEV